MPTPTSARRHYLWSAGLSERAVREAQKARSGGLPAIARVVGLHQATAAAQATPAVALMLAEQGDAPDAQATLNPLAFTTTTDQLAGMLEQVDVDWQFTRLVATLVQDAGRASEQAATAVRPRTGYVRYLSPPSCSRCAILAGRVYRYSSSFQRHPRCDCTMIPTTLSSPDFVHDPESLLRQGLVTGLSKADRQAVADGADLNQVVNVRSSRAGLNTPGRVLVRNGRPTPEGIYATATSRDDAIQRLIAAGYAR